MSPDEDLHNEIDELCEEGDVFAGDGEFKEALTLYRRAWDLVPEPKDESEAATWILSAIADAHFSLKEYRSALSALTRALRCPGGAENPFVHLRLGQCHFELQDPAAAKAALAEAYREAGKEIFADEHPKYAALLDLPAGER